MSETGSAVLLLQMGGPQTLEDIRPFLTELFSDPAIIPLPGPAPLRRSLAGLIAARRSVKVADRYRAIGGGSPLVRITGEQAAALQGSLAARGVPAPVRAVMRYCRPRAAEVLEELRGVGVRRVVALPLYPHYSRTTSGSSLAEVRREAAARGMAAAALERWGDDPGYIELLAGWIRREAEELGREAGGKHAVLFSAHGLPERVVRSGDPYVDEVRRTLGLVEGKTGLGIELSFQSRLGPVRWIGPSTDEVIRRLGADGVKGLLTVPVSFVSDHIETLWDMDVVYRELAAQAGIVAYRRLPAFNADPAFIGVLERLAAPLLS